MGSGETEYGESPLISLGTKVHQQYQQLVNDAHKRLELAHDAIQIMVQSEMVPREMAKFATYAATPKELREVVKKPKDPIGKCIFFNRCSACLAPLSDGETCRYGCAGEKQTVKARCLNYDDGGWQFEYVDDPSWSFWLDRDTYHSKACVPIEEESAPTIEERLAKFPIGECFVLEFCDYCRRWRRHDGNDCTCDDWVSEEVIIQEHDNGEIGFRNLQGMFRSLYINSAEKILRPKNERQSTDPYAVGSIHKLRVCMQCGSSQQLSQRESDCSCDESQMKFVNVVSEESHNPSELRLTRPGRTVYTSRKDASQYLLPSDPYVVGSVWGVKICVACGSTMSKNNICRGGGCLHHRGRVTPMTIVDECTMDGEIVFLRFGDRLQLVEKSKADLYLEPVESIPVDIRCEVDMAVPEPEPEPESEPESESEPEPEPVCEYSYPGKEVLVDGDRIYGWGSERRESYINGREGTNNPASHVHDEDRRELVRKASRLVREIPFCSVCDAQTNLGTKWVDFGRRYYAVFCCTPDSYCFDEEG
jgi:hypothetical protein